MNKESAKNNHLAQIQSGTLSNRSSKMSIHALEKALLSKFPAEDALEWDHTGLLAGDPTLAVTKVALALDPTLDAIEKAHSAGANVLLTHHPAFLEAPQRFMPGSVLSANNGALVWSAIEKKLALMNFHTALDVSREAAAVLPGLLSLRFKHILSPLSKESKKGYGQFCELNEDDQSLNLAQLAARCIAVFGRHPRVWGDFNKKLTHVVTCTGSAGDLGLKALAAHADVLICGEIRYHDALELSEAGLAIIDLGHDVSELPLIAPLVTALEEIGLSRDMITLIDQGSYWDSPESTRL